MLVATVFVFTQLLPHQTRVQILIVLIKVIPIHVRFLLRLVGCLSQFIHLYAASSLSNVIQQPVTASASQNSGM